LRATHGRRRAVADLHSRDLRVGTCHGDRARVKDGFVIATTSPTRSLRREELKTAERTLGDPSLTLVCAARAP
jgi:hypothetical protein